jgi:hypothetical protein
MNRLLFLCLFAVAAGLVCPAPAQQSGLNDELPNDTALVSARSSVLMYPQSAIFGYLKMGYQHSISPGVALSFAVGLGFSEKPNVYQMDQDDGSNSNTNYYGEINRTLDEFQSVIAELQLRYYLGRAVQNGFYGGFWARESYMQAQFTENSTAQIGGVYTNVTEKRTEGINGVAIGPLMGVQLIAGRFVWDWFAGVGLQFGNGDDYNLRPETPVGNFGSGIVLHSSMGFGIVHTQ